MMLMLCVVVCCVCVGVAGAVSVGNRQLCVVSGCCVVCGVAGTVNVMVGRVVAVCDYC